MFIFSNPNKNRTPSIFQVSTLSTDFNYRLNFFIYLLKDEDLCSYHCLLAESQLSYPSKVFW